MKGDVAVPDALSRPVLYSREQPSTPLERWAADDYKPLQARGLTIQEGGESLRIDAATLASNVAATKAKFRELLDCLT